MAERPTQTRRGLASLGSEPGDGGARIQTPLVIRLQRPISCPKNYSGRNSKTSELGSPKFLRVGRPRRAASPPRRPFPGPKAALPPTPLGVWPPRPRGQAGTALQGVELWGRAPWRGCRAAQIESGWRGQGLSPVGGLGPAVARRISFRRLF